MRYLKLFESFESGIEELNMDKWTALSYMSKNRGFEHFNKRELYLFGQKLAKTKDLDFYKRSDVYKDKKRYKVVVWFKFPSSVGSHISFYKFRDDYYLAVIEVQGKKYQCKCFEIDTIEGLCEWIDQIPKYHAKLIEAAKYPFGVSHRFLNESLSEEQVEDISDLFVEVADKYGLIEITGKEKDKGNGFWRITKFPNKNELYVIFDVDSGMSGYAFEVDMYKFMFRLDKLGYKHTRELWGKRYNNTGVNYATYQAAIWGYRSPN